MLTQDINLERLEEMLDLANKMIEEDAYGTLDKFSANWAEEILYILFGYNTRLTQVEQSGSTKIMVNPQ